MSPPNQAVTEPPATDVQGLKAASERRLSLMDAAKKTPETSAPAGDTPVPDPKVEAAPDGVSAGKETAAEGPAKPTEATPKVAAEDHSKHIPEEFRSEFDAAWKNPKAAEWLADVVKNGLRLTDYRGKTEKVARDREAVKKEREALDADKDYVAFAKAVESDDEIYEAVKAIMDRRSGKAPAGGKAAGPTGNGKARIDWTTATSEEIDAYLEQRDAAVADAAAKRALAEIGGREQASAAQTQALRAMGMRAKTELVDTGLYSAEEVDDLYDRLAARNVSMDVENVVETLLAFLPKREEKPKPETSHVNGTATGKANGASPLTRATGVHPSVNLPEFMRRGEAPKTPKEHLQVTLAAVNKARAKRGQDPFIL